jgi:hypothetical protein
MNDKTQAAVDQIKSIKVPSWLKSAGIVAGVAATVVVAGAVGCVAAAVQSDIGHEILDLF